MPAASSALTPLIELVALAAYNGWEVAAADGGALEWRRGANRIWAKFAKSTQRPRTCSLANYTDHAGTGEPHLGAVVFRGVGNGGDAQEAEDSLRRWLGQRRRGLTEPTQW
ncbi:hypothetical protein [Mycolicibacterium sp.]|uniref:hypothetical protein n=1 Tax=Mycolicibacterium sp. TaxID=2320850 RepID=UPI00355EC216